MPEGEEEEQEIKNLFENIMKENSSGKGNRLPGSPGSSESPEEFGSKEAHTKAHHNYITQMKEQIKALEKIQLSDEEIANLSDADFKH